MKVAIVHPDLGIGGAERLIVDAALGLQSRGHDLEIFTSHHDEAHCFQETKNGSLKVTVWGDFLPRSFFGRFQILFAILRNIYLSIRLVLLHRHYDVIISDQISVSIPILKLTHAKILFYCHFPDQLLSPRNSLLKKIYRWPFDTLEEITTGMADEILVNSAFTRQVFFFYVQALECTRCSTKGFVSIHQLWKVCSQSPFGRRVQKKMSRGSEHHLYQPLRTKKEYWACNTSTRPP
eukprot:TRINITY_DN5034_c0_g1_i2.p1 TRINITY_DN5034_c0_g1~~TRINITY_DN5034_c0_g1_i2.p1  ORF type:complete len:236 (-),score=36.37 TRINITY_DN5034_c0_g1_i2:592-1299(-)